jgi:hypothetical protein
MCIVSECTTHVIIKFYAFQKVVIQSIKTMYSNIKRHHTLVTQMHHSIRTEYFFANLVNHKYNSGIAAEWDFFATSHGKGPNDAACGTTKQQAAT